MNSSRINTVTDVPGQGARTPEEYRKSHADRIAMRRRIPGLQSLTVYTVNEPIPAYVTMSVWRVRCVCGDAPSTHPEWKLACCAGCGAIYTAVVFPCDRDVIEAVLLKRRRPRDRNWRGDWWTVADLQAQNLAHGEAI